MQPQRSQVLGLYRDILRLHRRKLEPVMRVLGDRYVRDEFKLHKSAKPEFVHGFLTEWQNYRTMLQERQTHFGQDLSADTRKLLDDQQKKKLLDLHAAATKPTDKNNT
ncbi:hypothetical protein H257_13787 [Aphanomyces astaci]|uniref:Succinate dehydrogenase assembly factor 3 n=1 Tax=Aphanomyces astaci TaxID=112090 RepID=W4FUR2_APHAT|nr:hypothetical protein H257_13787 [Aphanomyces astaci]ETV70686.1 hypothetical protein H257_13787 [Aphanomyces astaci]RQM19725.1 hypothetical protein B5M09_009876 [Aphanomyces astaci]|eukprot:XP_009839750.1 hypothetical protein H257_13787 [Aphanomyces astaci]